MIPSKLGKEINECNKAIVVPQYNLKFDIKKGLQTIEFTPTETGVIPWSCWMGMIPGTFIVVEAPPVIAKPAVTEPVTPEQESEQQRWVREFTALWESVLTAINNVI
ncbi:MAG: hypothetical protein LUO95_07225 [Methylococcaceae bacterium]|nr:hypothetical protein [Methylococcaceae bacterium]